MPTEQKALAKREERDAWVAEIVEGMGRADRQQQFVDLLGAENVERFKTVALHAIVSDSKLRACQPLSIIEAVRESAVLGLEPTGILGEAWIIPYGNTAELRVGWQGYLKLMRNSGQIAVVDCQVVYEKDTFSIRYGTSPEIIHIPYLPTDKEDTRGDFKGAYAWYLLNNGRLVPEWMPTVEIEKARSFSQARRGPWDDWWGEMARKTVIRRLAKRAPRSPQLMRAMELDSLQDAAEREAAAVAVNVTPARAAAMAALDARYPQDAPAPAPDETGPENSPEESGVIIEDEELERLVGNVEPS